MTTQLSPDGSTRVAGPGTAPTGPTSWGSGTKALLALTRVALGFVFLWAFLDKLFGLGYSTPSARSWLNGNSPTNGFLSNVEVGPLTGFFHSIAGTWWADWLFMLGLLGIGVALIAGVAMRLAAVAGAVMMFMMWLAEFPLDTMTTAGEPSGSSNPIVDYHIVYALVGLTLAALGAGRAYGLGDLWSRVTKGNTFLQ